MLTARFSEPRVGLFQSAAREHRGEMLAIVRRRVHIINGFNLAAALASIAEQLFGWNLPANFLFQPARAHRPRAQPADGHGCTRDLPSTVGCDKRRSRRDGKIAVPARELD